VSDESLQNSLVKNFDKKIGPHHFEPLSLIGKGSFGEVYLVRKNDGKQEKLFAMKVL
jgi:serine/threonine protein kinase